MAGRSRTRWTSAACAAAVCVLMTSLPSAATPRHGSPGQGGYSATYALERLQQRTLELESLALQARDQAKLDERHGGRDDVTDRMKDFAEHAHDLVESMRKSSVETPKINERIRKLMDDAVKVQQEWAKAKRRNPQTVATWNRTLEALTDVNNQFMAANGLAAPAPPVGTSGTFDTRGGTWEQRRETLARDLSRQAERADRLGRAAAFGGASDLGELRRQVDLFAARDVVGLSSVESHDRIVGLLFDAENLERRASVENAPADLREQVNALVGTLVQMRSLTGNSPAAAMGRERPVESDTGAFPSDPAQMLVELNQRTLRASELATDATLYELSGKLRDFRDRLREFDRMGPQMERSDRLGRLDSLLREAQERQRDLAEQHAPLAVVTEWNSVVGLLTHLRNAS